jgi:hypothetical protein
VVDRKRLKSERFVGFVTVRELRASALSQVPKLPGVYEVLYQSERQSRFLERSPGGRFKGKDPTVTVSELETARVSNAAIVYIGKAGRATGSSTLRTRLRQYLQFGAGQLVGHWGGRYIWQLADAEDLVVCWRPTGEQEPADVERQMLEAFQRAYGCLPLAI